MEDHRALIFDGGLGAWAVWVAVHGAAVMITVLTVAALTLRVMILWRQWGAGK